LSQLTIGSNVKQQRMAQVISKAPFTLGVRPHVQPKSSIPIGAKVEISPKGFTLGVKAEIEKKKKIQSAPSY
jgi:hypothetical protein